MEITIRIEDGRLRVALKLVAATTLVAGLLYPLWAFGDSPQIKHRFHSGDRIRANDFNENFDELKRAVDDNNTRLGPLSSLKTSTKVNVVGALNELLDSTASRCGDLTRLRTSARGSLVQATNELFTRIGTLEARVAALERRHPYATFSPTTFPDIIMGADMANNVSIVLRQPDAVRHLSTTEGDLNAIQAFADAPGTIMLASNTLDGNRNVSPIPSPGGVLALDVRVHYNNSTNVSPHTWVTLTTLMVNLPTGAVAPQRFTFALPSVRAAAPADATSLAEIVVQLNATQSTITDGGIGAIRATALLPLNVQ